MTTTLYIDLLTTVTAFCYLGYVWSELRRPLAQMQASSRLATTLLIVGFVLHLMTSLYHLGVPGPIQFSLGSMSVLVAWGAIACTLYLYFAHGYRVVALIAVPLVMVTILVTMYFGAGQVHLTPSTGVTLHISVSLLAYATLVVTAIQAITILALDRQLKGPDSTAFIKLMPPLETVEVTATHLLRIGVGLLTLVIISGFSLLWQELQTGRYLTHMSLAMACWILYTALVCGQLFFGWRGQTSAKLSLAAFLLLLIGFLGHSVVFGYGA